MGCSQSTSASYVAAKAPADKFAPYLAAFNKAKAMESSNPNAAERAYKKVHWSPKSWPCHVTGRGFML